MWQIVDPRPLPLGTAIWIVDLGGMGLSDLGSDAFQFFKRMSVEVGMHYPERLYKYVCPMGHPPTTHLSSLLRVCHPCDPSAAACRLLNSRDTISMLSAVLYALGICTFWAL